MSNLLILSPPAELNQTARRETNLGRNALDVDFLKEQGLENKLDLQNAQFFQDRLTRNFLENHFLDSLFDIVGNGLDEDYLKDEVDSVVPDWRRSSGVIVTKDEGQVGLCRDNGGDIQCITTPVTQNSLITQVQGSISIVNRINSGGNTTITVVQR